MDRGSACRRDAQESPYIEAARGPISEALKEVAIAPQRLPSSQCALIRRIAVSGLFRDIGLLLLFYGSIK